LKGSRKPIMYPAFLPSVLRRAGLAAAFVAGAIAVTGADRLQIGMRQARF